MRIRRHADGTYSLIGLTGEQIRDLESALAADATNFLRAAEAEVVPSTYRGWSLAEYRRINGEIGAKIEALRLLLAPVARPTA